MAVKAKAPAGALKVTTRQLNRATLARQMLLGRESVGVVEALTRVVGLQAQWPKIAAVGLWSRLDPFTLDDLAARLRDRSVVRATAMRGTIHLLTADDFCAFRPALQPVLTMGMKGPLKERAEGRDIAAICREAAGFFEAEARPFEALRDHFLAQDAEADERALGHIVRCNLPLVQVPTEERWSFPATASFTTAASWLGRAVSTEEVSPVPMLVRYLRAFGPASTVDVQGWSGFPKLKTTMEAMASQLRVVVDEHGKTYWDVPDGEIPDADTAAPVRLLAAYDNILIGRGDERFVPEAFRKAVFLPGLRVAATVLVDGVVAGTWTWARVKTRATVTLQPLVKWTAATKRAAVAEAERFLVFAEDDAKTKDVVVAEVA